MGEEVSGHNDTVRVSSREAEVGAAMGALRPGDDDDEAQVRADVLAALGVTPQPVRLGRYVLGKALGKGGAGAVFQAHDERLGRKVAVKLVRARVTAAEDASMAQRRLIREARAAARMSHPNVVEVFDVGKYNARDVEGLGIDVASQGVYLVMELVEGVDLSRWLRTPRSQDEILRVMRAAGRGLAASHAAGLVHRDFKPANVMVCIDGSVKVADFGLARLADSRSTSASGSDDDDSALSLLTEAGLIIGTPPYMAPEQQAGQADETVDQYAYCVALFEALVGQRPFRGTPLDMYALKVAGTIPQMPGVPAWLRAVIVRGLDPLPAQRFESMEALLREMQPAPKRTRLWPFALGAAGLLGTLIAVPANDCARYLQPAQELARAGPELVDSAAEVDEAWRNYCAAADLAPEDESLTARRDCLSEGSARRVQLVALWQADQLALGELHDALGELPPMSRCEDAATEDRSPVPAEIATDVHDIRARLTGASTLIEVGRIDRATSEAHAALADAEATRYLPVIAEARQLVGRAELDRGRIDVAAELLEKAFWEASEVDHQRTVVAAAEMLSHLEGRERRDFAAARKWERHAEAALGRRGATPETRAAMVNTKAINRLAEGDREAAAALMAESIQLLESVQGVPARKIALLYNNLGEVRSKLGDYDEANRALARAAELRRDAVPGSPAYASTLATQAQNLARQGKLADALPLFTEALTVLEAAQPDGHPYRPPVLTMLGAAQGQAGNLDEAAQAFTAALQQYDGKGLRGDAWATAHNNLALTMTKRERWADAQPHLELAASGFSAGNPERAEVLGRLAEVELELGRPQSARSYLARALAAAEIAGKPRHFDEDMKQLRERLDPPEAG